jgi:hypothetical protein
MKLNKREKILGSAVGITGLLALLILAWQLGFAGSESLSDLNVRYKNLSAQVELKKGKLDKAQRASAKVNDWLRRSLPANAEVGRTLYLNWLRGLIVKSGFKETKTGVTNGQTRRGVFEEFRYTITAQATLQQLTHFLFDFYQVGYLHKISHLQITPDDKTKSLSLNIIVEALSLADADNRDQLPKVPGSRLQKKNYTEYAKMIVDRNVFTAYAPPKPKTERPAEVQAAKPKFDHLEFTKLTGIIESDGRPEAWIETKTTGELFKVHQGEEPTVASVKIKVLRIGIREIELQIGDDKRTIGLGQNLLAKP